MRNLSKVIIATVITTLSFVANATLIDSFDRPDSPSLGAGWADDSGSCAIVSNKAVCQGIGASVYTGVTTTSITADFYHLSSSDGFGSLILNFANSTNSLYVKLQSQDSIAGFEYVGYYFGTNGAGNGSWTSSDFEVFPGAAVTALRMTLSLISTDLQIDFDIDFDGISDYQVTKSNVPLNLLGSGIGIGGWGATVGIDNLSAVTASQAPESTPAPAPATLTLMILGLLGVAAAKRARR